MVGELKAEPVGKVRANLGEGAVWDWRRGRLLFVDIHAGQVFSFRPDSGRITDFRLGVHVGDVHPTESGRLLVAPRQGVGLWRDGSYRPIAEPLAEAAHLRVNDGNVDPRGRYFIGTMAYAETPGEAVLFRLDGADRLTAVLTGLTISNGIDWSPDGRTMYFVDSPTGAVEAIAYRLDDGSLGERRPFARVDPELGAPDGLTVDARGGVWVAVFGGGRVLRFTPDGRLDAVVTTPGAAKVTSCCFGGPNLDTLYITTAQFLVAGADLPVQPNAGRLFAARPGVVGKPARLFPDHGLRRRAPRS
ncbi:MAG: SMP-30/gluconolactonase/LRE family protein [Bifidobacteriaceae bacterium]|nr:SMP-30/gluconolactonase/LRE family protein [Bifidobacteriaceae bacterium]